MTEINAKRNFDEPKWSTDFKSVFVVFDDRFRGAAMDDLKESKDEQARVENALKVFAAEYDKGKKLRDDNVGKDANKYKEIWSAVTLATLNFDSVKKQAEAALEKAELENKSKKIDVSQYRIRLGDFDIWKQEVTKKAIEYQLATEKPVLENKYKDIGETNADIETLLAGLKPNAFTNQTSLTDTLANIRTKIDDLKKAVLDQRAKQLPPSFAPAVAALKDNTNFEAVLKKDKTAQQKIFVATSDDFKTLIEKQDDPIAKARLAAGAVALSLYDNDPQKRKMLAFSQMY